MLNPFTVRKILKKGTPGEARIHSMTMPPRGAAKFNLGMTLQVYVEGMTPYEVQDQWIVSAKDSLGFGMMLPVKVNPKDPQEVAIDWDTHRERQATEDQSRRDQLAAGGPVGPEGIADLLSPGGGTHQVIDTRGNAEMRDRILESLGVDPDSIPARGGDDTISKLERLAKLHESGALTDEEFAEQKRRLLGS